MNAGIFPLPVVIGNPIEGLLLVQVKLVLGREETNEIPAVELWLQITWGKFAAITGIGLTTILKLMLLPEQLFDMGVTVIMLEAGTVEIFIGVNAAILPNPEAGMPIDELLLIHWYCVPATADPLISIGPNCLLPQAIMSLIGETLGIG